MATYYWKGGSTDTSNWTPTGSPSDAQLKGAFDNPNNWDQGSVPVTDDIIIFDETVAKTCDVGSDLHIKGKPWTCYYYDEAYSTGGSLTLRDFNKVIVRSNYTGAIGGIDSNDYIYPLRCTADKVIFEGQGNFYFDCDDGTGGKTDLFICNTTTGVAYLYSQANNGTYSDEFTLVLNYAGNIIGKSEAGVGNSEGVETGQLAVRKLMNLTSAATSFIEEGSDTAANGNEIINDGNQKVILNNVAGTLSCDSNIYELSSNAGIVNIGSGSHTGDNQIDVGDAGSGNGTVINGGTVNWHAQSNLYKLTIYGGKLKSGGQGAKQLGDGTNNIAIYGGELDLQNGGNDISLNGTSQINNINGDFKAPRRSGVSWS